jgi:hypothetical protein
VTNESYEDGREGNFILFVVFSKVRSDFVALNVELLVNNEFETAWKEVLVAKLRYAPGTCLEGLRETAIITFA